MFHVWCYNLWTNPRKPPQSNCTIFNERLVESLYTIQGKGIETKPDIIEVYYYTSSIFFLSAIHKTPEKKKVLLGTSAC